MASCGMRSKRSGNILRVIFLVGFVGGERNTLVMRIVIANSPRMYRESLAISILREHPEFEVMIVPPEELDGQVKRFQPHVFVRDDDGVDTKAPDGVLLWVGIMIDDHLKARIAVNGEISELHDVSFEEVLAALEGVVEQLQAGGGNAEVNPSV